MWTECMVILRALVFQYSCSYDDRHDIGYESVKMRGHMSICLPAPEERKFTPESG